MIYVTHDQVEAMTLADRIVVLSEGRIEQVGTPLELYERPDNLFVAGFIGSPKINLIPVVLAQTGEDVSTVTFPGGAAFEAQADTSLGQAGSLATLGLRPEQIRLGEGDNSFEAQVRFVEDLGALTFAYLDMAAAEQALTVQLPGHQRLKAGETVRLTADSAAAYLFDPEGRAFPRHGMADAAESCAVSL
jgi:multiple sugar transport system ATP-binding protein